MLAKDVRKRSDAWLDGTDLDQVAWGRLCHGET